MKQPSEIGFPECVMPSLILAVSGVIHHQQRLIQEHLLSFGLGYIMAIGIFLVLPSSQSKPVTFVKSIMGCILL